MWISQILGSCKNKYAGMAEKDMHHAPPGAYFSLQGCVKKVMLSSVREVLLGLIGRLPWSVGSSKEGKFKHAGFFCTTLYRVV